jgi:hypothetical protein
MQLHEKGWNGPLSHPAFESLITTVMMTMLL